MSMDHPSIITIMTLPSSQTTFIFILYRPLLLSSVVGVHSFVTSFTLGFGGCTHPTFFDESCVRVLLSLEKDYTWFGIRNIELLLPTTTTTLYMLQAIKQHDRFIVMLLGLQYKSKNK